MVRLLVRRMNVIRATLVMLWKGRGQSGVALRINPYATRHPAKVAVSAMMNSHIAIFLAGTENVGSAIAPALERPSIAKSAWLTLPPTVNWLQLHPKQKKQVHPQDTHK